MSNGMSRVAAYCRVSTNEENQLNSYKVQIEYYTEFISKNPEWELIGIFADEGLSGTQTKNRKNFNRLMTLCRRGRIDLILCKSISRFARNTLDCLKYIRELRELGISVIFEKENINTLSDNSEFIIALYASFAQAESESISRNITWGIERSFKAGKISYKLDKTLGYQLDRAGKPVIVENEARAVREIFRMYADGYSTADIAKLMTENGVKRRNGSILWKRSNVLTILKNEKYVGDVILQKTYTVDCLTHRREKNTGQKNQYVFRNRHDAIIDRELFDRVQIELAKRTVYSGGDRKRGYHGRYQGKYVLSELLTCAECGANYRRVIWTLKDGKKPVWRCERRLKNGRDACRYSSSIYEDELKNIVWNSFKSSLLYDEKNEKKDSELTRIAEHDDMSELSNALIEIKRNRELILDRIISEGGDPAEAGAKLKALRDREEMIKTSIEHLKNNRIEAMEAHYAAIDRTAAAQKENLLPEEFNEPLLRKFVSSIIIDRNKNISVRLKGTL